MARKKKEKQRTTTESTTDKKQLANISKIVLIGIFVAVLAVGGGIAGSMIVNSQEGEEKASIQDKIVELFEEEPIEALITLDPFTTNLKAGEDKQIRYIQLNVALSVVGEENQATVNEELHKVRDSILSVLRNETADSMYKKGEDGNLHVKKSIRNKLNEALGEDVVKEVFFTDMVVQ